MKTFDYFKTTASSELTTTEETTVTTQETAHAEVKAEPAPAPQPKQGEQGDDSMLDIHHLIVLDESGSMSGVTAQTISGCNETLQTIREMQKQNPDTQHHYVSIYAFDDTKSRYIIQDKSIGDVRDITHRDYSPYGCTPLFDAVGKTLTELKGKLRGTKTMGYVTIITDGYENASREFTLEMVKKLIEELKASGVIFSFIGANIDARAYASSLNIDNAMQFEQSDEGMRAMWANERRSKMRSNAKMEYLRRYEEEEFRRFAERENRGNYYNEAPQERLTPVHITSLRPGEIFVFGSHANGRHTGGAAAYAVAHFGAIMGQPFGLQGQSFAIPTVGVSEEKMYESIKRFTAFAMQNPQLTFLVTPIGCGHGGWSPYVVAPMFRRAVIEAPNVKLPQIFWDYCNE